jgi:hypothetical protein
MTNLLLTPGWPCSVSAQVAPLVAPGGVFAGIVSERPELSLLSFPINHKQPKGVNNVVGAISSVAGIHCRLVRAGRHRGCTRVADRTNCRDYCLHRLSAVVWQAQRWRITRRAMAKAIEIKPSASARQLFNTMVARAGEDLHLSMDATLILAVERKRKLAIKMAVRSSSSNRGVDRPEQGRRLAVTLSRAKGVLVSRCARKSPRLATGGSSFCAIFVGGR